MSQTAYRTHHATEVTEELVGQKVTLSGWVDRRRDHGGVAFIDLRDNTGLVQVVIYDEDMARPLRSEFVIQVVGEVRLRPDGNENDHLATGKIEVVAESIEVLAKSDALPFQVSTALENESENKLPGEDVRLKYRYLDLRRPSMQHNLKLRSDMAKAARHALEEMDFTEVETPTLQSIAGGASARPFITHFNALNVDMYMRIATELYLKRLIVGGFEGVYEIGKNFRNEGMDKFHNPEFTCMELYVQYKDYNWMMAFIEQLLETICKAVNNGATEVKHGDHVISFKAPFRRLPILEAIQEKTGFDCTDKTEEEIRAFCLSKGMEVDETMGKGKLIDELFGEFCEGTFIQPTFITDYPVEMSPLTKMHRSKPGLTERFELMVNGKEVANAYSELNDPIDQEMRFKEQMRLSEKGDDEAMIIDHDFLRALQYGMPPTSGIGIGIDRLTMLMTGQETIQEVILFPQMKPEKKMPQDSIEAWAKIGVPEEWVYVLRKAGFNLLSDICGEKAQGLQQKLGEINKKYKLGYEKPSVDEIQRWIDAVTPAETEA